MLVDDINLQGRGISPRDLVDVNGVLYFTADDGIHGRELWRSDGTAAGTSMVRDIRPDGENSYPSSLINVNGTLFFTANDGVNGTELWKSDGTAAGTVLVKDIRPGTGWSMGSMGNASDAPIFTDVNGTLFFRAHDGTRGLELWKSDGTAAGTVLVKDINSGSVDSYPTNLINVNGTLYLTANDGTNGFRELWKSDGTDAGTVLVKDIRAGSGNSYVNSLTSVNGTVFFSADDGTNGSELWKTDGTTAGTVLVKDIRVGSGGSGPSVLTNVNGTLFFAAFNGTNGTELWKSDGTAAGTVLVKDIRAGTGSSYPNALTTVNGTLFFRADDGTNGDELWKSDGTTAGTVLVKDIRAGSVASSLTFLTSVNGTLFFRANDGTNGEELWKSDGTAAGTVLVKDIRVGSGDAGPNYLTNVNGTLFFAATENTNILHLWKSDGTSAGTSIVFNTSLPGRGSFPREFTSVNGTLFFSAFSDSIDANEDLELWKSDGTAAGTALVKDIRPGILGSHPRYLTSFNGALFFIADDGINGFELWKSDGTAAGTLLVKDIRPGNSGSYPKELTEANGTLFFKADNGTNGIELWKSDGTAGGTVLVQDINPGAGFYPTWLTNVNGTLYFTADDGTNGMELWKSDGTASGTVLVKDINVGSGHSFGGELTNVNGTLFFSADDGTHGMELWTSNGTSAGTVLVKDIQPGVGGYVPRWLTNANGTLFFFHSDGTSGVELWKSNGTANGTVLVKDINPNGSSTNSWPYYSPSMTSVGGTVFFTATDGTGGVELWKSDGTAGGTVLVRDIIDGAGNSYPANLTNVNGTLFFRANDVTHGVELWKSDGTIAGTVLVKDIAPGSYSSVPDSLTNVNGSLYFTANDRIHGHELWKLLDDSDPTLHPDVNIPAGTGTITIERQGDDVVVSKNSTELFRSPLGSFLDVTLIGDEASEDYVVDIDGLSEIQLPGGLVIHAGEGVGDNDTLILTGSETVSNYDYTTGGPESGTITLDGFTVAFSEFEPILDNLSVVSRTFSIGTSGDTTIVLAAGNPGFSTIDDGGSGAFESLSFKSPTNSLHVVSGSGNDTITVGTLDATFAAVLAIAGGDGNDVLNAASYNLPIVLDGGPGNDALTGGSATDWLDGGNGQDVIDGGTGADVIRADPAQDTIVTDPNDQTVVPPRVEIDATVQTFVFAVGTSMTFSGTFSQAAMLNPLATIWTFSHIVGGQTVVETRHGTAYPTNATGTIQNNFVFDNDAIHKDGSGVYTVTLTIRDTITGATTSDARTFVVYDPSAGSVTGGGWINSPAGAYAANPALTGKATFGFLSKYQNGNNVPTGTTEFQFKVANFTFKSSSYEWLVVSGAKARFRGVGTVNGAGGYGFELTAWDGQAPGGGGTDKFRIKIWLGNQGNGVVYDNMLGAADGADPTTALGGGSIVIHKSGQNLVLDASANIAPNGATRGDDSQLFTARAEAVAQWAAQGLNAAQLQLLQDLNVVWADLPGNTLGLASESTNYVWIDRDAAGYGWSINSVVPQAGLVDLFSTLTHELGHVLGYDHDVLGESLRIGERHEALQTVYRGLGDTELGSPFILGSGPLEGTLRSSSNSSPDDLLDGHPARRLSRATIDLLDQVLANWSPNDIRVGGPVKQKKADNIQRLTEREGRRVETDEFLDDDVIRELALALIR